MTYRITGLARDEFAPLFELNDAELAKRGALRVTATADKGFPCRVSLEDARTGETLILLNHVSHDVATPFRASHAIYVREAAEEAVLPADQVPPVLDSRTISLRGFDVTGMLRTAAIAHPGETDARIREMFAEGEIAYIHAHNAAPGCFAARVERA
jgi:hypothetical protein